MYRIAFIVSLVIISAHTALGLSGSGTEAEPWRIETPADFNEFAADANYWAGYTRLETDVNLAGLTYTTAVIAPDTINSNYDFDGTAFTGVFDGNDHKITDLTIDGGVNNDYLGLFGYIGEGGEVKNLGLEGVSIVGTGWYVGGLVGENGGSISNCYSIGDVNGDSLVGGLVGQNGHSCVVCGPGDIPHYEPGYIFNSYSIGSVQGISCVGGLVGVNEFGDVFNSYSTGSVSGDDLVGGLAGENGKYHSSVLNCYSTGDVNGVNSVGGLVGYNWDGFVSNCYSTGDVSGYDEVGGLGVCPSN